MLFSTLVVETGLNKNECITKIATTSALLQILGILSRRKQEERKSRNQDFKAAPAWSISSGQVAQNSQDLEKSACGRDPKTRKARGGPKELSTDISALCPLQDPREAYLRPR